MTKDTPNGCHSNAAFVLHATSPTDAARALIEGGKQKEPFYLLDMDEACRRITHFRKMMPRVQIFYAMKANDSEMMLKLAIALGLGFDCASPGEIHKVLQLNVNPKSIIFALPTKTPEQMTFARDSAVTHTTFDTLYELKKIKQFWPDARLLIRIRVDSDSIYKLGEKFGCDAETEAVDLLDAAAALDLRVIGVAFHVGSACSSTDSHILALQQVKALFDHEARAGRRMSIVDIGGGFLSDKTNRIDQACSHNEDIRVYAYLHRHIVNHTKGKALSVGNSVIPLYLLQSTELIVSKLINAALEEYFPDPDIQVVAEPGRYICDSSSVLYCSISNVRRVKKENTMVNMIYLNDGLFGTLRYNEPWHTVEKFKIPENQEDGNLENTILWGPSCDSTDRVMQNCAIRLPKCTPFDWLVFGSQGAYSFGFASSFSCLPKPLIRSVISSDLWNKVKGSMVFSAVDFVENPNLTTPLPSTLPQVLPRKINYSLPQATLRL